MQGFSVKLLQTAAGVVKLDQNGDDDYSGTSIGRKYEGSDNKMLMFASYKTW